MGEMTGKGTTDKAILVVSFGTSYADTCAVTIGQIEKDIQAAYPQYRVYRAWTSGMIRRKLQKRDGIRIFDVKEAMKQMKEDGIRKVVVQPTHVLNGIENDLMTSDAMAYQEEFEQIVVGAPLLTFAEDNEKVIKAVVRELHPADDEALVLMGHGTEHFSNAIYAALDYQFKDLGYPNIFMGTVEAYPTIQSLIKAVKACSPRRVLLAPFMIVAGDHANNDLAGDDEDSWKTRFEQEGFAVECILRGLGEYREIRELLLAHTEAAVKLLAA